MCVESRGRDSPHREQPKIDAVVPQLQFDYGYMGDGGPLQIACFLVGAYTSSGALHATMVPDSKKRDMPYVVAAKAKWVRDLWYSQHTENQRQKSYNQLISDPSTYVKKRAQRSDDSVLLRHMDDVVSTGPDEHLMCDFEHMKTSLYQTDVVVLRHEGDTVNLGLEISKTSSGFEVKNSIDLVESLWNLYELEKSKPTANPGRRSTVMELASATPLVGHDYSNFRRAVGNLIFMAPWRPDMQFAIRQLSTQVFNPTIESKRAVKQLMRYLKGTQTHLSSSETARNGSKRIAGTRWSK